MPIAKLALEDGTIFTGHSIGAEGEVDGEVCFNTAMTGYQEILTDPSYCGQIVTMTYPQIGNYGINDEDFESRRPFLAGFIVRESSRVASNFRSTGSLNSFLSESGVLGLAGIDTRALVRRIRSRVRMKGVISTVDLDDASLVAKAKASPGLLGRDLVSEVVPHEVVTWDEPLRSGDGLGGDRLRGDGLGTDDHLSETNCRGQHVVALDFGMKWNIARHLRTLGCQVTIMPGNSTAEEVLSHRPDGVFLSNGPGDPEPLSYAIEMIRNVLGTAPIFGICLGHQLLALACGARTFKLKFGHRGANQPVLNCLTGRVEITAQNHGFAVDEESLPDSLEITHRNLNDNTIAGLRHRELPAYGVQYHPEASAGPHDSQYLFAQFLESMNLSQA